MRVREEERTNNFRTRRPNIPTANIIELLENGPKELISGLSASVSSSMRSMVWRCKWFLMTSFFLNIWSSTKNKPRSLSSNLEIFYFFLTNGYCWLNENVFFFKEDLVNKKIFRCLFYFTWSSKTRTLLFFTSPNTSFTSLKTVNHWLLLTKSNNELVVHRKTQRYTGNRELVWWHFEQYT